MKRSTILIGLGSLNLIHGILHILQFIQSVLFEEFKIYLESKFEDWMNWNNYGYFNGELNYGWDIDHINPLNSAQIEEEIIRLNHYTNLQPLCSYTNRHIKMYKTDFY